MKNYITLKKKKDRWKSVRNTTKDMENTYIEKHHERHGKYVKKNG